MIVKLQLFNVIAPPRTDQVKELVVREFVINLSFTLSLTLLVSLNCNLTMSATGGP